MITILLLLVANTGRLQLEEFCHGNARAADAQSQQLLTGKHGAPVTLGFQRAAQPEPVVPPAHTSALVTALYPDV